MRTSGATVLKLLYPVVLLDESNISVFAVNTVCILAIIHYEAACFGVKTAPSWCSIV
jgi:hypothetical protein